MFLSSNVSMRALVVVPSTIVTPLTTTVPLATASRRWPVKRPVNPGNVVVFFVVSFPPIPLQVIETVMACPSLVVTVPTDRAVFSEGAKLKSAGPVARRKTDSLVQL
jgi:hypothetical protein